MPELNPPYGIPQKEHNPDHPTPRQRLPGQWEDTKARYARARLFTPRLQEDLAEIPFPDPPTDINLWEGEGLYLYGKAGTGKTVTAAHILLDVQKWLWIQYQNKDSAFTSVPVLFSELKKSFNRPEMDEHHILEQQEKVWLLVLDDLGVSGKPSEWLLETLYLLINHRYQHKLPTIITSNLDLKGLSELYGDVRITSRIERMCRIVHKKPYNKP